VNSFRKTTQFLAPGRHSPPATGYDIYPAQTVPTEIALGFEALARRVAAHERVVIDGVAGVLWPDFRMRLTAALAQLGVNYSWLSVDEALLPEPEIERLIAPFLGGDDPLFGTRNTRPLREFFQAQSLAELQRRAAASQRSIIYGTGAALVSHSGFLLYLEVPKNEIQFRARAGSVTNFAARHAFDSKLMYKRFYFVDWPALRAHQAELLPPLDLIVDMQRPDQPALMAGEDLRRGLALAARTVFRARPWFEPGPWGGQCMKQRFAGLSPEAPNLAWSFELIAPENGLAFTNGGRMLEVNLDWLMFQAQADVLGLFADRFRYEFPIRFDYLDTFGGGNLSVQCHPGPEYAWRHFGERYTQDETYYLVDCAPGANVFLGFVADIKRAEFERELTRSAREATAFEVAKHVQTHPSQKHGLYLIPNGTIHCSGKDNLVLEISATPYIFTFKMYDWMRLDLDGRPRSLNIRRALENLHFERQGRRVPEELIARPRILSRGDDGQLVHLPTHTGHFYDVHRFEFRTAVEAHTEGSLHVLNVVEGPSVVVEVAGAPPRRFASAETFVIPAAAGAYRLRSDTGQPVKVIKAFLKAGKVNGATACLRG
jgi:mannose-6-phosphate isomerase class I